MVISMSKKLKHMMIIMVMTNVDKNDVLNDETYADRMVRMMEE